MPNDVELHLCVGDENGNNTMHAVSVELRHGSTGVLELASDFLWRSQGGVRCYLRDAHCMQFGRIRLRISCYRSWVGNWCWDAAALPYREAKRAMVYLAKRGGFSCEGGLEKAVRWWERLAGAEGIQGDIPESAEDMYAHGRHPF